LLIVDGSNHCRGFQMLNKANKKMQPKITPTSGRLRSFRICSASA
jgi:hypothetical protein